MKTNSSCVGGRHDSSTTNIETDIIKQVEDYKRSTMLNVIHFEDVRKTPAEAGENIG